MLPSGTTAATSQRPVEKVGALMDVASVLDILNIRRAATIRATGARISPVNDEQAGARSIGHGDYGEIGGAPVLELLGISAADGQG